MSSDFILENLVDEEIQEHLYESINGGMKYPISTKKIDKLSGSEESGLMWFKVSDLWLRSDRLRLARTPSKISTLENPEGDPLGITASIHDIARTYQTSSLFHSAPVLVCYEEIPGNGIGTLLYEGRHRAVGAYLAEREFILGRQIAEGHSTVISQNSSSNLKYFQKPIFHIKEFTEMFRQDSRV